jgi:ankyrin repeat protein
MRRLISQGGDMNVKDARYGRTPVFIAAKNGHVECIRVLHGLGANVNLCGSNGCSPVYIAAELGHVECTRVLHELGADVHLCNDDGISSVYVAAEVGHVECIVMLYELDADVNLCGIDGASPVVPVKRVLEAFVGGSGSRQVSFQSLLSAFALRKET